jgi:fumarylacetoacetase
LHHLYRPVGTLRPQHATHGCNLRPGDLIGSGTISGADDGARACITELTNAGADPLNVGPEEFRTALEDGDEIILRAHARRAGAVPIGFGACDGRIAPALAVDTDEATT